MLSPPSDQYTAQSQTYPEWTGLNESRTALDRYYQSHHPHHYRHRVHSQAESVVYAVDLIPTAIKTAREWVGSLTIRHDCPFHTAMDFARFHFSDLPEIRFRRNWNRCNRPDTATLLWYIHFLRACLDPTTRPKRTKTSNENDCLRH